MMKRLTHALILAAVATAGAQAARHDSGRITTSDLSVVRANGSVVVKADLVLDSLNLNGNHTLIVTPLLSDANGNTTVLPSVMVNGRNMHYVYERGAYSPEILARYQMLDEVQRHNGKAQSVGYTATVPMASWMLAPNASLQFVTDTCGCGHAAGTNMGPAIPLDLNPAPKMRLVHITPAVTELPISIHEGKARVQFELDKTELHVEPYRCRNGQRLDNREQIAMIEDSVRYALSDPNVEIARIEICGYASPESPYLHNEYLATNRSRALSEYLAKKFDLPEGVAAYSAVPENWGEFRTQVEEATDITAEQRADLLALIDAPTYGPADFDAKERTLKTDPRFAKLYASKILPEWFPHLRATKFMISTRLKPMSDEKLAEVILSTPEKLSLNQMMRVARLYAEGSPEFNRTIEIALKHYPDSPEANLNAAVTALQGGDLDRAEALLTKAGNSAEAENARGVLAAHRGDFDGAKAHFRAAGVLPEATKNLRLLED